MKKVLSFALSFVMLLAICTMVLAADSVTEDIKTNPAIFLINSDTVVASGNGQMNTAISATETTIWNNNGYLEIVVNTEKADTYFISLLSAIGKRSDTKISVAVNGTTQINAFQLQDNSAVPAAYTQYREETIGSVALAAGKNTIRLTNVSTTATSAIVCKNIKLYKEDLNVASKTFAVNKHTVAGNSTLSSTPGNGIATANEDSMTMWQQGAYVEMVVYTTQQKKYDISMYSAIGKRSDTKVSVSVNGTAQITSFNLRDNSGAASAYVNYVTEKLGSVTLTPGKNVIRFTNTSTTNLSAIVIKSFTLENGEGIYANPVTFVTNKYVISGSGNGARVVDYNENSMTLWEKGCYVEYTVETNKTQEYTFTLNSAINKRSDTKISVLVNGATQISAFNLRDNTGAASAYVNYVDEVLGTITLTPGKNVIRIKNDSTTDSSAVVVKYFCLQEKVIEDHLRMTNFDIVTEDGARVPYVIADGMKAYAQIKVSKKGNYKGKYLLIVAQYSSDKVMVDATPVLFDVSTVADGTTKTFRAPITYRGNGGKVKAFLMKNETYAPIEDTITYKDTVIFDAATVERVLNETVSYADATKVLNSAGTYYADYSEHTEDYDVEAIFYDSVVGKQTKVFAYIGIPKGASEANPVPGVVCVHGGTGIAYKAWVQTWVKKGYAAIAMSMQGDGPDATTGGGAPTPYKGVYCWSDYAYRSNYQNAGMYQNVLNVIRAHNVLRAWPGVDETKTGITGISWGGITTTTVIGVDPRFKFAVPVYGCGYLDQANSYMNTYYQDPDNTINWDPANFAARTEIPTLYINGNSDPHFPVNITSLTSGITEGSRMSIHHQLGHGHPQGRNINEIYRFADGILNGYDPFITITGTTVSQNKFVASYTAPAGITVNGAILYYITENEIAYGNGSSSGVSWKQVSTFTHESGKVSFDIPEGATFCYATLTDNNGSLISSKFLEIK